MIMEMVIVSDLFWKKKLCILKHVECIRLNTGNELIFKCRHSNNSLLRYLSIEQFHKLLPFI